MIGIYKITSPTNRVYIGQSKNIKKRLSNYKSLFCKKQVRLYNSFVKYGIENHVFEVLEECVFELLNERERYYQDFYNVISESGLNCTLTEVNLAPRVYSDETKLKMRNSRLGLKITSTETLIKMRNASLGNTYCKGHKHTEETRKLISEKGKGRKNSQKQKDTTRLLMSKKVVDLSTNKIYNSISECALINNIHPNTLGRYLNGKRKNKTNFIFYDNKI